MQDRCAGDIGDYGKIALLKALQAQGLSIGVNWYKTETLAAEKQADGKYYLIPEKLQHCDSKLANKIMEIAKSERRSIKAIEEADLISGAIYYSDQITVEQRNAWHQQALESLKEADIVFWIRIMECL